MAKLVQDGIGAISLDGIETRVGMTLINPSRTLLMLPLQGDDSPMDTDEMEISGAATFNIPAMFKKVQPSVDVTLKTGNPVEPSQDVTVPFTSMKSFEPEHLLQNIPLLKSLNDKQDLIIRLQNLMQEGVFQKLMKDKAHKEAFIQFLRSVRADIEAATPED
jgi:predicted component of type VI protein secretion system